MGGLSKAFVLLVPALVAGWLLSSCDSEGSDNKKKDKNHRPVIVSVAPDTVTENTEYRYRVICEDKERDTLSIYIEVGDTCEGDLEYVGYGKRDYIFYPDETRGGTSCVVAVKCTDRKKTVKQITTVNIFEVNYAPAITNLPALEYSYLSQPDSFNVSFSDSDIPLNRLTPSMTDSCSFSPIITSVTLYSSALIEWTCPAVPETCTLNLTVTDDGDNPPDLSDSGTLTISCVQNLPPQITSAVPTTAVENTTYSYDVTCVDPYGDDLTITASSVDTCGGPAHSMSPA